jgi:hypothetical protein
LPGSNIKAARALYVGNALHAAIDGDMELLAREGRKRDSAGELFTTVAEHPEKVHHVTINVVVSFDGRRFTVQKHGS